MKYRDAKELQGMPASPPPPRVRGLSRVCSRLPCHVIVLTHTPANIEAGAVQPLQGTGSEFEGKV